MHDSFQSLYAEARRLVHTWKPGRNGRRAFEEFVSANAEAQHALLGIQICGYLFDNPLRDTPVLAFRQARYPYSFPYVWSDPDRMSRFQPLSEDMFIVWRTQVYSNDPSVPAGRYPSEATCFLPHPEVRASSAPQCERVIRDDLHCHYCSLGEMLFYLAAWRLLLREACWKGVAETFKPENEGLEAQRLDWLWHPSLICGFVTPERMWLHFVEECKIHVDLWQELSGRVDARTSYVDDLIILGIVSPIDQQVQDGLVALLRYVHTALGRLPDTTNVQAHTAQLLQESRGERYDRIAPEIQKTIRKATRTLFGLGADGTPVSIRELLHVLHSMVRFPLLPYFYWYAVDPRPKSHMVIPVLRAPSSRRRALVWQHEPRSRKECLEFGNMAESDVAAVGVAVLGMDPSPAFDWTLQDGDCPDVTQLEMLRSYVELLGQIPADEVYYGQIKRQVFTMQQASFLGHEVMHPVLEVKNILTSLSAEAAEGKQEDTGWLLRPRVFGPLLDFCGAELLNFRVLAGEAIEWKRSTVPLAELLPAIGVILGDKCCMEDRYPDGVRELRSKVNPLKHELEFVVQDNAGREWSVDRYKTIAIVCALVNNAVRATWKAKRTDPVRVTFSGKGESGIITVRDRGVGVAKELYERVFEIEYSTKNKRRGGLGLFLARAFAQSGGGNCRLSSRIGVGTVFRASFPGAVIKECSDE